MKKYIFTIIILFLIVLTGGCSSKNESENKVLLSSTDYSLKLDINTPEGLAKESGLIYQEMINEEITIEEGYDRLLKISCEQSAESLKAFKEEFEKQIEETIKYFNANKDKISEFNYAETNYEGENKASIKRIQMQKNGKQYYFQQDFIKENNVWKIKGDNNINDFKIMKKFLFWYI